MKSAGAQAPKLKREAAPFLVPPRRREFGAERDLGKGVIAGLIGGLIGTIVMTEFQNAWSAASAVLARRGAERQQGREQNQQQSEDATMKAAGKLAGLVGRKLSYEQKKKLGPVVHYGFGTLQGGAYGAATEMVGIQGGLVSGASFGAALFVLADEVAVPELGLSGKPGEYPLSAHLYALISHLVYGVSTEIARRGLRAAL